MTQPAGTEIINLWQTVRITACQYFINFFND